MDRREEAIEALRNSVMTEDFEENIIETLCDKGEIERDTGIDYNKLMDLVRDEVSLRVQTNTDLKVYGPRTNIDGDSVQTEGPLYVSDVLNSDDLKFITSELTDRVEKQIAQSIDEKANNRKVDRNMYYSPSLKLRIRNFTKESPFIKSN